MIQLEIKYLKSQCGGPKLTDKEVEKLIKKRKKDYESIAKAIENAPPFSKLFTPS